MKGEISNPDANNPEVNEAQDAGKIQNSEARESMVSDIENSLDDTDYNDERTEIEANSPYSEEINKYITSKKELDVYQNADLHEESYGEPPKACLVRDDISANGVCDHMGRDNSERIKAGLSPINNNCETVELHHIGQSNDSPFAELTQPEHRGTGNDSVLHDKNIDSQIDRKEFASQKKEYWADRVAFISEFEEDDF